MSTGEQSVEPQWLTPEELALWMDFGKVMTGIPTLLSQQLQRDADLSFAEYYVLAVLSDQPEFRVRMSRLAFLANAELSRLSHLMRRLENRGLVRREPDPEDGRVTLAILTSEGHALNLAAAPAHVAKVRSLIFDAVSESDQRVLRRALARIAARVDDCD